MEVQYIEMVTEIREEIVWVEDEKDSEDEKEAEIERQEAENEARIAEEEALKAKIERENLEAEIAAKEAAERAVQEAFENKDEIKDGDYTMTESNGEEQTETSIYIISKEEKDAKKDGDETEIKEFNDDPAALEKAKAKEEETAKTSEEKRQIANDAALNVFEAAQTKVKNASTPAQKQEAMAALKGTVALCSAVLKNAVLVNEIYKTVTYFDESGAKEILQLKNAVTLENVIKMTLN